jgi:hypothetical protein
LHELNIHVPEPPNHDSPIAALIRYLDELLAEAERLRREMAEAVRRRADSPFWPDRRRSNVPHHPDRRRD